MPLSGARTTKPTTSASETRLEIVIVRRSLAAAKAISAGNSRRRAMSRIMGYTAVLPTRGSSSVGAYPRVVNNKKTASSKAARKRQRPRIAGAFEAVSQRGLLQRGRDRAEGAGKLGADALDGRDDGKRDTGGDQAVFDGGCAGLILQETRNEILHQKLLCTRGW